MPMKHNLLGGVKYTLHKYGMLYRAKARSIAPVYTHCPRLQIATKGNKTADGVILTDDSVCELRSYRSCQCSM